jgi:NADH-quinone oxidoreductase subunit C
MPNLEMIERATLAREQVNNELVPALLESFAGKVEQIGPTNDQIPQVFATPDSILEIAEWLRARGFNMLVDIGAADYYPNREPRFDVVYHFRQLPQLGMIRVRVRCTEKDQPPTLSNLWTMANPAEREVWDQFGISFRGHPALKRMLNPDDWEGYPLRRDYPMRGPRDLIQLEMPADENRYPSFADEVPNNGNGK